MKRLSAIVLALSAAFCLCACNGENGSSASDTPRTTEAQTEAPTAAQTEVQTEAQTEAQTEVPTETPTESTGFVGTWVAVKFQEIDFYVPTELAATLELRDDLSFVVTHTMTTADYSSTRIAEGSYTAEGSTLTLTCEHITLSSGTQGARSEAELNSVATGVLSDDGKLSVTSDDGQVTVFEKRS